MYKNIFYLNDPFVSKRRDLFGNKAANLSVLINGGINVPNGLVLSSNLFDKYKLNKNIDDDILLALSELDSSLLYAVRSSSVLEDSVFNSYAGFFKTFLNCRLEDVLSKIKEVYDDTISKNIFSSMGIIIQEMVGDILFGGVIFTYDILNNSNDNILLEIATGGSNPVVSGDVVPSLFVISKSNGSILYSEGNMVIDNKILKTVKNNALKIERIFKNIPQDVEFVIDRENKFFCLQSRPVILKK